MFAVLSRQASSSDKKISSFFFNLLRDCLKTFALPAIQIDDVFAGQDGLFLNEYSRIRPDSIRRRRMCTILCHRVNPLFRYFSHSGHVNSRRSKPSAKPLALVGDMPMGILPGKFIVVKRRMSIAVFNLRQAHLRKVVCAEKRIHLDLNDAPALGVGPARLR